MIDINISRGPNVSGDYFAGGIIGYSTGCIDISFCNISINEGDNKITASSNGLIFVGGVIGLVGDLNGSGDPELCEATISYCKVASDISGIDTASVQHIGGIVGCVIQVDLNIDNSEYFGNIDAVPTENSYVGGIVGCSMNSRMYIAQCATYGSISSGEYVGGIAGFIHDIQIPDIERPDIENVVVLQTNLTGTYTTSVCTYAVTAPTVSYCYVNSALGAEGDEGIDPAGLDESFWNGLGFSAENGWELIRTGSVEGNLEAHLADLSIPYTLTVTGGGIPCILESIPLEAETDGSYTVYFGWPITIVNNDANYLIRMVRVNGVAIAAPYRFIVTGNTAVEVTLELLAPPPADQTVYYTVAASAGSGGSISPSGNQKVRINGTITFTITANEGYEIKDVLVDGVSVGAVSSYTFSNVIKAHSIIAEFSPVSLPDWENPYGDVEETDWYYEAVEFMSSNGLMGGVSQDEFEPQANLTRGMLVTILHRLEGEPEAGAGGQFGDVASGLWYSDAVAWASANGLVGGYGNGNFGPKDNITREQMAQILYNYAKYKGFDITADENLDGYADGGNTSSWAETAMRWAVKNGLLQGRGDGRLDPTGTATRAEVAEILMRFIKLFIK